MLSQRTEERDADSQYWVDRSRPIYFLLQCADYKWCCGDGSNCCGNSFQAEIGTLVLPSATLTITISASATEIPTSSVPNPLNCPKNKGTVIGAAVGVVLGVALLATLAALWFVSRRQSQHVGYTGPPNIEGSSRPQGYGGIKTSKEERTGPVHEFDSSQPVGELPNTRY